MDWLTPIREFFGFTFPFLESLPFIRVSLGFILVFFLPGFAWTLVFFRRISVIERVVFSFGLSIVVVTLCIFSLNKLIGVKITGFNSVLIITVFTVVPVVFYYLKSLIGNRSSREG